jgi:hypothetical protein
MRTPSIVPHDAERDTYLVLGDFGGRLGCAWRETDAESADRALCESCTGRRNGEMPAGSYSEPWISSRSLTHGTR